MKLFRHPPLLFWALVCVALLGVILTGLASSRQTVISAVSTPADTKLDVMIISEKAAAMNAVAAGAALELNSWAEGFAVEVDAVRTRHGRDDALGEAYDAVAQAARRLATTDAQDAEAVLRAKTELSLAVLGLKTASLRPSGFSSATPPSQ